MIITGGNYTPDVCPRADTIGRRKREGFITRNVTKWLSFVTLNMDTTHIIGHVEYSEEFRGYH